jgi:hypothetical protein
MALPVFSRYRIHSVAQWRIVVRRRKTTTGGTSVQAVKLCASGKPLLALFSQLPYIARLDADPWSGRFTSFA